MKLNYGYEYAKFRAEQKKQREYYLSLGMAEEAIAEIEKFDKEEFLSRLRYMEHTQSLSVLNGEGNDDDSTSPLYEKFADRLTVTIETYKPRTRYDWIDELENPKVVEAVKRLTDEQIELITLIAFDGVSRQEISVLLGISSDAVYKRLERIRKKFQRIFG